MQFEDKRRQAKRPDWKKYIEHVFNELENVHLALFNNEQSLYTGEAEGLIFFFLFCSPQFVGNLLKGFISSSIFIREADKT